MAPPAKPRSRLGTHVVKTFKDESFRAFVPTIAPRPSSSAIASSHITTTWEFSTEVRNCQEEVTDHFSKLKGKREQDPKPHQFLPPLL